MYFPSTPTPSNFQATLASSSSGVGPDWIPHHPICCQSDLFFDEEGVLYCEHVKTEKGDPRTQAALNHSVAVLLIELAQKL